MNRQERRKAARQAAVKLTPRQREILVLAVERGGVDVPYGPGAVPFRTLANLGLAEMAIVTRGYSLRPTDAGRSWVEAHG